MFFEISMKISVLKYVYNVYVGSLSRTFSSNCAVCAVSKDVIENLERLALVDFGSEAGIERLEKAIEFADQLMEVDVSGVEPLFSTVYERNDNMRDDVVLETSCREELMKIAPVTEEFYYVAPPGAFSRNQDEN